MSKIIKNNTFPQTEAKLRDIQNKNNYFINKLENLKNILSFNDKNIIDNIIIITKRLEEESKRGLYFVTIQGSLKTGKSTLTNLLIKKDIAITKAGQDTTKTPYIITKSTDNESKIIVYYRTKNINKENSDEIFKQILEAIMDDIKGLNFENPYKKYFNKRVEPLDKKKIEKYTVEENLEEALFINIQIANNDNNWILAHDIAILDTPGIEGLKATANKQIIEEVKKRTNMLIVMQSTVTPVNSHELKELKDYQNEDAEIRLLHNQFELKPWADEYDEKKLKEEETKAIKKAKEIIQHELNKLPISNSFNLAKVYDYMQKPKVYKKLEKEYKEFEEFNKDLIETINKIKIETKQRKAYTQFKNLLRELKKENSPLNELKRKYQQNISEIEDKKNQINTQFEKFKKNMESFVELFYISEYKEKIENYIDKELLLKSDLKITNPNIGSVDKIHTKEIKQAIKEIEEFIEILNEEINVNVKDKTINNIKEYKKNLINHYIDELKKFLKENKLDSFVLKIPDIYFSESIIPNIVNIKIDENNIESLIKANVKDGKGIKIPLMGEIFKDRIIEVEKLEKYIKDSIFKSEISNKKREFFETLKANLYNKIREYVKDIEKIQNEILNEYEQITLSRKKQSQQVVKEIENFLHQIEEAELQL